MHRQQKIIFKIAILAALTGVFLLQQNAVKTTPIAVAPLTKVAGEKLALSPYQNFLQTAALTKAINTSTISMQFFGDIMIDRNVATKMGKQGLDYIFEYVSSSLVGAGSPCPRNDCQGEGTSPLPSDKALFGSADLLIANLEGAFAKSRIQTSKSIAFRFDPKWAKQFKKYGFSVVSLANNHSLDMGSKNDIFSRKTLAEQGIGYFGKQYNYGAEFNWVATNTVDKVAFVGVEFVGHNIDRVKTLKAITAARQQARYVIAFNHGGTEYKRISNQDQRNLYHWFIDNGVDAVIGHHPHVIEEAEVYKGKLIFYSLGNFIFDQYFSTDTQEGLSVGLIVQDGKVASASAIPFYSVKSQVFPMEGKRLEEFYAWLNKNSRLDGKKFENGKLDL